MENILTSVADDISSYKKQRRNIQMLYIMIVAILALIWFMYFQFIRYDEKTTITQYQARHHGLLILAEDLVFYTKDSMGSMGLNILENLMVNTSDMSKKSIERKKMQKTIDSTRELVGYGNMLIFFKNRPVFVSGKLEPYFTRENKYFSMNNKEVEEALITIIKSARTPKDKFWESKRIVLDGKEYLITCGYFHLTPSKASVLLYAEVEKILQVYGYYGRKKAYFIISLFLSVMNIAWGMILSSGISRQNRALASEMNMTRTLHVEISERKKAEEELKRHKENLETMVKEKTDELKETAEQLLHAQKMEAIGHLAGGMAHEFNNIIATISGTAEMLMKRISDDNNDYNRAERIVRSANRAKSLTTKLLTFARKEKLNIAVVSVNNLVNEVIDVLESTIHRQIKICSDLGSDVEDVSVDANQITQAILNICLNACDAMRGGGVLTLKTETIEGESKKGKTRQKYSSITISDTGSGIDADIVDKIFDPFFTTKEKEKGTGLGLSVCHGIIGAHNGKVELLNTGADGTSFRILLPCYAVDANDEKTDISCELDTPVKSGKILIIDDDVAFIEMVQEALEMEGFEVVASKAGSDGVAQYKNNRDFIDVVMLDLMMSDMDGVAVFNELVEFDPCIKIVLCSGYSVDGTATALLDKGAISYIQKPFRLSELMDVFTKVLQSSK